MKGTENYGQEESSSTNTPVTNNKPLKTARSNGQFSFFKDMAQGKNGLYILCALLLIIIVALFNKYIFFGRLLLFTDFGTDSINFDWPQRYFYAKYLQTEGIPTWSFAQGLGANVFPASLGDAGNWLLYALPPDKIAYALAYVEMLKLFFGGIVFYMFLKKINVSPVAALIGGLLFAFSGFMTIGSVLAYFATEGCYLVFLLYSVELLRTDNNYVCFPIAIALAAANNSLLLYMHCLLLGAYLLCTFLMDGFEKKQWIFLGKVVLTGALGLGIAAFFMFGNIYVMLQSPRGSGSVSMVHTLASQHMLRLENRNFYVTFLLRMFGNDMSGFAIGKLDRYKGSYQYLLAPCQYCGLISLLLLPQIFALGTRKLKWLAAVVFTAAVVPVIFSYFRYAFWLFSGDYFRTYSLLFTVVQILFAVKALDLIISKKTINLLVLWATFVGLAGLVLVLGRYTPSTAIVFLRKPVIAFLLLETVLLGLIIKPRYTNKATILLVFAVFAELIFSNWGTYNYRESKSNNWLESRTAYNDSTIEAVKYLHAEDHGFFRLEKNYGSGYGGVYKKISWDVPRSYNDAQMQDYFSSPSYFSFNNKYYVRFLQKMNFITDTTDEKQTRWIDGVGRYPLMQMLVSNKYVLLKSPFNRPDTTLFDSILQIGDIHLFKNRYALPLGFTYNACISETELNKAASRKQIMLLKAAVVNDTALQGDLNAFTPLTVADTAGTDSAGIVGALYSKLKADTLKLGLFTQSHITGKISVDSRKILFFSIPYDNGWRAKADGKNIEPIMLNYGFWGCVLSPGQHNIDILYRPPFYYAGMGISGVSLLILLFLIALGFRKKPVV